MTDGRYGSAWVLCQELERQRGVVVRSYPKDKTCQAIDKQPLLTIRTNPPGPARIRSSRSAQSEHRAGANPVRYPKISQIDYQITKFGLTGQLS